MKHIFIINPKAGKSSAFQKLTHQIDCCFRQHPDQEYEICLTHQPGEGTEIARQFAQSGEPIHIYACGGDGSAFDVLNGIVGYENAAMGVIPRGTGNDFLKIFTNKEQFASVESQLAGQVQELDAVLAGDKYCLNQASMGLDAQVCAHKDKFRRWPLVGGQLAYVLALFYCFFSAIRNRFVVTVDDQPMAQGDYLLAVAANGRFYGGGFQSAPTAMPDDGKMECMTIKSVSRFRILSLLKKYSKGKHLGLDICRYSRGQTMTVCSEKETVYNLDGEVFYAKEVTFQIVPGAVRFVVPKGCEIVPPAEFEK